MRTFENKSIFFIGDSITEDGGFIQYLRAHFAATNRNIYLHNKGIPGGRMDMVQYSLDEELSSMRPDYAVVALGVNDFFTYPGSIEIGSTADIAENWQDNQKTFAGYIGQIVQRLQEVNSDAVFFLITLPSDGDDAYRVGIQKEHAALMYDLAEYFDNSFVIDLGKYAPTYDEEFKSNYYVGGHLSTAGYYLTSKMIMSYTDYLIRHNTQVFRDAGLEIPEDYTHIVTPVSYNIETSNLTWQPLTVDPNNSYWCKSNNT